MDQKQKNATTQPSTKTSVTAQSKPVSHKPNLTLNIKAINKIRSQERDVIRDQAILDQYTAINKAIKNQK